MRQRYDVAIIGSGFSGSILARILANSGLHVLLVDASRHPRFAIGESSTPIADFLMRRIGERYALQDLVELSNFGAWQKYHSDLACGLKRGFSYFDHRAMPDALQERSVGQRSLLVAASPDDDRSDTHWYRCEVDQYLFRMAAECGVDTCENTQVSGLHVVDEATVRLGLTSSVAQLGGDTESVEAGMVVDASGGAGVSARLLGRPNLVDRLQTRSVAAFAHFEGVQSFSRLFNAVHGDERATTPFDADDAAQHHLIDGGWIWMLRMNNAVTSIGVTIPFDGGTHEAQNSHRRAMHLMADGFSQYPLLNEVLAESRIIAPSQGVVSTARLQRMFDPVITPNCLMLPTCALTLDPLHSTGIAHALAGVLRVADLVLQNRTESAIEQYRRSFFREAEHLDRMVRVAYDAMNSFNRFHDACMVYFAAAIASEEQIAAGEIPESLWLADDPAFVEMVGGVHDLLKSAADDATVSDQIRELLVPWNTVGLMDRPDRRYAYTATK